jgi:hypothetical protein
VETHCWLGALCYTAERGSAIKFPTKVVAITDVLTILEELENKIPDKSWMLYLMEMFDEQIKIPVELNLICQFDDRNNFWAIFKGVNRYKFTKVLPSIGHSYLRQIIMHKNRNLIEYRVSDLEDKNTEYYDFRIDDDQNLLSYEGSAHFTGVEWWNKVGNSPFPTRYKIEISNLKFGQLDFGQIIYRPYNILLPNKDAYALQYPISFSRPSVKEACICYTITSGSCNEGLKFLLPSNY